MVPEIPLKLWWLARGEKDPVTGVHAHELVREAGRWWDKTGRSIIADALFHESPPNQRTRAESGILAGLSFCQLEAHEKYKVVLRYYENHYLEPMVARIPGATIKVNGS